MAKTSTKAAKPVKKQESSSDSSSSSSSSDSSSSDSSDSEESADEAGSDSSSSDSSDSEKEETSEKKKEDSSDSDSDSSDSESEDEKDNKKEDSSDSESEDEKANKKEDSSDSDSSDSDSSDSEDDKKKEDSSSSSSDSSSDSSDSDSDSDSDSEDNKKEVSSEAEPAKRSASSDSEEPAAKKAKTEEEPATLFVGRLSWNIDDDWLKREFEPLGGVISARVMMERETGKSRGYGYVDFETKAAAEKALNEYQGREVDGRPINLDMSNGKPKQKIQNDRARKFGDVASAPSDTLFVGNLSFNADRDVLQEAFGEYGSIVSCRVPTHPDTQQPKGFGYVQFSSVEEAQAALNAMNGSYIANRACRLDFSTPRDNAGGNRGGSRGGFGGRGGRGGRGGFGGRERAPPRTGANAAEFKGTRKTFD